MKMRHFSINMGSLGIKQYSVRDNLSFDDWPYEMKLEYVNLIKILYELRIISLKTYLEKYQTLVEEFDEILLDLKEMA